MPLNDTTLVIAIIAAAAGFALGLLGMLVWATRRQAAAAALLEQERQLKDLAEQSRADMLRQRDELGRQLDAVRAAAAEAARVAEGLRAGLEARLEGEAARATDLDRRLADAMREREQYRTAAIGFESQFNQLRVESRASLDAAEKTIADQRGWIDEQKQQLEERFRNLANQLLEEKTAKFTATNAEKLEAIITPFRNTLGEFRLRVDAVHTEETRARASLAEQIASLTQLNQQVSQDASNLTRALTVNVKATGNWGESILKGILERSGLRQGQEYELQVPVKGEAGEQRFLDALLHLPEERQVIIDSKVSNKAWTDYVNATTESAREEAFALHLSSLRAHVKGLAARNYPDVPELKTVDFVLMFVPVESALLEALAREPALYEEAYSRRVMLVTPTNLMVVVKLVESLWTVQKRKEFAEEIAEAGAKLYDKLVGFAENFDRLGARIEALREGYEDSRKQLGTGKGNAISIARGMIERGVKAKKKLPEPLLRLADAGSDDTAYAPVPDAVTDGPAADAAGTVTPD
ncbi:MAG: DNA recombination protein RmuC [Gammaproteobacteria bacterium]